MTRATYTAAFLAALSALPLLVPARMAHAEAPVVTAVELDGQTLHVTLTHPDTGWDHYADGWEVEAEDGTALGLRVLAHPHVDEQPFTRSLTLDAPLPAGPVYVRARCNVEGWSETRVRIER